MHTPDKTPFLFSKKRISPAHLLPFGFPALKPNLRSGRKGSGNCIRLKKSQQPHAPDNPAALFYSVHISASSHLPTYYVTVQPFGFPVMESDRNAGIKFPVEKKKAISYHNMWWGRRLSAAISRIILWLFLFLIIKYTTIAVKNKWLIVQYAPCYTIGTYCRRTTGNSNLYLRKTSQVERKALLLIWIFMKNIWQRL